MEISITLLLVNVLCVRNSTETPLEQIWFWHELKCTSFFENLKSHTRWLAGYSTIWLWLVSRVHVFTGRFTTRCNSTNNSVAGTHKKNKSNEWRLCWKVHTKWWMDDHFTSQKYVMNVVTVVVLRLQSGWQTIQNWTVDFTHTCERKGEWTDTAFLCIGQRMRRIAY